MDQNYRSLMIAVLAQALKDYTNPKHHCEVAIFLDSPDFIWFWSELARDMSPWPTADSARRMIIRGEIKIEHAAYH